MLKRQLSFSMKVALALLLGAVFILGTPQAADAGPPPNFTDETILSGLTQPISLTFLPDGRMLVLEKDGTIFITDPTDSPLTTQTYMQITNINTGGERGLIDITLDPDFETNSYFYLYYSTNSPKRFHIARFEHLENSGGLTSRGDLSSEVRLWTDTNDFKSCCHYGGGVDFGPDGNIYFTVGDEFDGGQAQDLTESGGSVMRIAPDGSIPADNPFIDGPGGNDDAIWAFGLRNPFRARWDIESERFFIGEVGGNVQSEAWEDIHIGEKGANYGWPFCEGLDPFTNPDFPDCDEALHTEPLFAYPHLGSGASITAGIVYRGTQFPDEYREAFFYGDYTRDFIRYLKFDENGEVLSDNDFIPFPAGSSGNAGLVVFIEEGPDGSLYYIRVSGQVRRVQYDDGNQAPTIVSAEADDTSSTTAPFTVNFSGEGDDAEDDDITLTWDFGDGNSAQGENVSHTYTSKGLYLATLTVSDGSRSTTSDPIMIEVGEKPNAVIAQPADGTTFKFGDTINLVSGSTDPDGSLDDDNHSWLIRFVRPDNTHPGLGPVSGEEIDFPIPVQSQGFDGDVFYEVILTVTDDDGLIDTATIVLNPEKVDLTLNTIPTGLRVTFDGLPHTAPFEIDALINFEHIIGTPPVQCINDTQYSFQSWSDDGASTHTVNAPDAESFTYTATFVEDGECSTPVTTGLVMQLESDFGVSTNGNNVTTWLDQTTSNNDLTSVGNPMVNMVTTPTGQPAVSFDGSDDYMGSEGFTGLPVGGADRSVFMVVKYDSSGWGGFSYGNNATNQTFGLTVGSGGGADLAVQGWGNANDYRSGVNGTEQGWIVQSVVLESNAFIHYQDGAEIDSESQTFNTANTKIRLGAEIDENPKVDMDVAAVLVYDRALTEQERQQVETYLQTKYLLGASQGEFTVTTSVVGNGSITVNPDKSLYTANELVTVTAVPQTGYAFAGWSGFLNTTDATESFNINQNVSLTATFTELPGDGIPTSGLVQHLETDTGVQMDNNVVSGWTDQSGQNNDMTGAGDPSLVPGSTPTGMPAIVFDGNGDKLERTDTLNNFPAGASDRSMFIIVNYRDDGYGGVAFGTNSCNQTFGLIVAPNSNLMLQGWCNDFGTDIPGEDAGWMLQSVVLDENTFNHYKDGASIDTEAHTFNTVLSQMVIGGEIDSNPLIEMDIAAVLIYNRALTDVERQQVETYLTNKYLEPQGNIPPVANNDFASVENGGTVEIDILDNDEDVDGVLNQETINITNDPQYGEITEIDALTGAITYVHDGNNTLTDSFTYTVDDEVDATSNEATVNITISEDGELPSGLVLHLETDFGVSTGTNGVAGWLDQAGQGNDLTAAGDPQLVENSTPSLMPAIIFDGDGDKLERVAPNDPLNGFPSGATNRSMFLIANYNSNGFGGVAYGTSSCGQAFGLIVANDGDLAVQRWCNDFETNVDGNGAGWLLQSAVLDGSTLTHYLNGGMIDTQDTSGRPFDTSLDQLVIGAEIDSNPFLTMDVAAVLLFNRALTDVERQQVEAYLTQKYLTPPTVDQYTLTIEEIGNGSVTVNPEKAQYDDGEQVTLTAVPQAGNQFDGYSGDLVSTNAEETITITADTNITATFSEIVAGDIPTTGLVLQLETDAGVNLNSSDVTSWDDQSGQANNVTASGNPQFDVVDTPSGMPAISLDGDGDKLERTDTLNGFPTGADDRSMFIIVNYLETGYGGVAFGTPSCNQTFGLIVAPSGNLMLQGWCNDFNSGEPGTNAGWLLQSVVLDENTFNHYKDGAAIDTETHAFNTVLSQLVIGGEIDSNPLIEMDIAAVILYDRALTDVERQQVEAYLTQKYLTPPTVDQYTLTITELGNGSVTVNPEKAQYDDGEQVTLTAVADVGNQFDGYSGDLVSTNVEETITITADTNITATFSEIPVETFTLTITELGNGSVTVNPEKAQYDDGEQVTLTAVADVGNQFDGYSGDLVSTNVEETITITADTNITATFSEIPVETFTLTITELGNGSVTVNPEKAQYDDGEQVTLTAVADAGNQFDGYSGDLVSTNVEETITITADTNITATFSEIATISFTLDIGTSGPGIVTIDPEKAEYEAGDEVTLTAVPNTGAEFTGWTGYLNSTNQIEVIIISEDVTVTANFQTLPQTFELDLGSSGPGTAIAEPFKASYDAGEQVTITAIPDTGAEFTGWTGDVVSNAYSETITINANTSVTANFAAIAANSVPTTGLVLQLETDAGVNLNSSDVTSWDDQSGQANNVTASGNPQFDAVDTPSGMPAISFDGNDDKLERTDTLNGFPSGGADRTMFVVVDYDSNGFGGTAFGDDACGETFGLVVDNSGDLTVQRWCNDFESSENGNPGEWLIQSAILEGTTLTQFLGIQDIDTWDTSSRPFNTDLQRLTIGAEIDSNPYLDMDIAAVLLYDRALTPEEHAYVTAYLDEKYLQAPPLATLEGVINIEGRTNYATELTVEFYQPGTNTLEYSFDPTSNALGQFTITDLVPGEYDIYVKSANTLQVVETATLVSGNNFVSFDELKAGDANNDNYVDSLDASLLTDAFNLSLGQEGYNGAADFNGDETVDEFDFDLMTGNFNTGGAEPPQ